MKKIIYLSTLLLVGVFALSSCGNAPKEDIKREEDMRALSDFEYTLNNLTATDDYGRVIPLSDLRKSDKQIGVFYHVWHGYHNTGIFNITELLASDPDSLYDPKGNAASPKNAFHYWGEPLYGYYNSSDPWVITRHMELLTMAGVDYLVYDLTNTVIYTEAINSIFAVLDKYQKQGFKVPKVAFYTNSASGDTMRRCYNLFYKDGKYSNCWYSLSGEKPLIIGIPEELDIVADAEILDFFEFKHSQWPYDRKDKREGFPWMDWEYPQTNFSGIMSVSLAQHPGMRMSEGEKTNQGRGFDYTKFLNNDSKCEEGLNFEGQWQTVYDNINKVNNVFITGWNEWIAQKLVDGQDRVFFVDTFNEAYSRDIEMMKGGYADNFYLQLVRNARKYAFSEAKHYIYHSNTMDVSDFDVSKWENVQARYVDFDGDALERNFISADKVNYIRDNSNRNDIVKTYISKDDNYFYIRVETKDNITERKEVDYTWMNILISTNKNEDNWYGFDYVINRNKISDTMCSIERLKSNHVTENCGSALYYKQGNVIQYRIPFQALGLDSVHYNISFKILDNVQDEKDIEDYYVSGDCAPIGRLAYSYGY